MDLTKKRKDLLKVSHRLGLVAFELEIREIWLYLVVGIKEWYFWKRYNTTNVRKKNDKGLDCNLP